MNRIILLLILAISSKGYSKEFYAFCSKDGKGWANKELTKKFPDEELQSAADEICDLPIAADHGYENAPTSKTNKRCISDQKSECVIGEGGEGKTSILNPHNVPGSAWFVVPYLDGEELVINGKPYETLRCQCGCFIGETVVLTTLGDVALSELVDMVKLGDYLRLNIKSMDNEFLVSDFLLPNNFTIGPESKPVIRFILEDGNEITMTENHPALGYIDSSMNMYQAKVFGKGDFFVKDSGEKVKISEIETYVMPTTSNLVYNIDTKMEKPKDSIIIANGLKMGDLRWQTFLSAQEQRAKLLVNQ